MRLYYAHGFNSIGVNRIIFESNTAKMTYYKYFKAKVNIYEACLNHEISEIKMGIIDTINAQGEEDYIERITSLFSWFYIRSRIPDYNGMLYQKAKVELTDDSCFKIIDNYSKWLNEILGDLFVKANIPSHESKTRIACVFIDGLLQSPQKVNYQDLNNFLKFLIER